MTTDTLEFPPLDPAAAAPAAATTNAIAASIKDVQGEVCKFDAIAAGLRAIQTAHPLNVIVDAIHTPAGMKLAEAGWRAYRNPRLEVERARKAAKAPVLALGRAIDAFAGDLEQQLRAGEDHYKAQIDAEEERKAKERAEAEAREQARKEKHRSGIANIRCYMDRCHAPGITAERIARGIAQLEAATFGPEWEEFAVQAANAQCETLDAMRTLHAQAVAREAEAARQDAIRRENERVAAELAAERERIAREAEAIRQEQARLESERRLRQQAEAVPAVTAAAFAAVDASGPAPETPAEVSRAVTAALMPLTGTPDGHLAQDLHRGLSDALASKPDAMQHAREAAAAIEPPALPPTHADFLALVMTAFAGRFPSHPKPDAAWWTKVRSMGEALQAEEAV